MGRATHCSQQTRRARRVESKGLALVEGLSLQEALVPTLEEGYSTHAFNKPGAPVLLRAMGSPTHSSQQDRVASIGVSKS